MGWLATVADDEGAAREAALRAVALDPREPNARAVLAVQRRDLDDWARYEDTLLGIVADSPDAALALGHLTLFYQSMGRCRDSWRCNERANRIEPFNPSHQARRALKHWIFGRLNEADQVADRALQIWPRNPTVWNARLILYAYTDRAPAALALLDDPATRPENLTEPTVKAWRSALTAIASRAPADIAAAVATNFRAATLAPGLAANAIMTFSVLGELDAAYRVADGLLNNRGPIVQRSRTGAGRDLYSGPVWGRTQFLFIPATAAFRADRRFTALCEATGHIDYWRKRGVWPDDFVRGSLVVDNPA
ncbi:MAG TPA: hypothetical protein VM055_01025 [Novosphingobium sp.]|nr:hypothetical protein [Novosphingobium sp.]